MICGLTISSVRWVIPSSSELPVAERRLENTRKWVVRLLQSGVGRQAIVASIDRVETLKAEAVNLKGKRRRAYWLLGILHQEVFHDSHKLANALAIDIKLVQRACEAYEERFGCIAYQWPQLLRANLPPGTDYAEAASAVQKKPTKATFWASIRNVAQLLQDAKRPPLEGVALTRKL
jgi:hypothetical protein